ncbi:MAG: metallophosphoesterase [Bryobacteraceae bacterium]
MRIAILSDIHANLEALSAFREDYDELWVLGDLVNYGPDPAAAIEWVRARAAVVVRGNHDHSIGYGVDPRCSARYRAMAEATRRYTESVLGAEEKRYLRELPLAEVREVEGERFLLCHATPQDLFCYRAPEEWGADADFVLAGHTHVAFLGARAANPGSLGQPKMGDPRACYAVWEGGRLELKRYAYDVEAAVRRLAVLPVDDAVKRDLAAVLRTGGRI